MTNRLITTALAAAAICSAAHAELRGDWKLYPSFDSNPISIVDTPTKAYVVAAGQPQHANAPEYAVQEAFLFAYDKQSGEMTPYTKRNYLSDNMVSSVQYNPRLRYLFITYMNGNIDLLYDDNTAVNIPSLMQSNLNTSKSVNNIRFDQERNRAYLATDFGYLILDDESGKILESRIYNKALTSAARVGDKFLIADSEGLYWVGDGDKAFSQSDFKKIGGVGSAKDIMPLTANTFAFISGETLYKCTVSGSEFSIEQIYTGRFGYVAYAKDGYFISRGDSGVTLASDGTVKTFGGIPGSTWYSIVGTWDGSEVWQMTPHKGLSSYKSADGQWTATNTAIFPNSPSAYRCRYFTYSPKYGMLINNHEVSYLFSTYYIKTPAMTCGLKDGIWTNYGYPYTNTDFENTLADPNGLTIDPDNPDLIYYGSFFNGIQRKNLADPTDMLLLSHPKDPSAGLPQYRKLDDDDSGWDEYCNISSPAFDAQGNMWATRATASGRDGCNIYVWPADARRSGDASKIVKLKIPGVAMEKDHIILPLKASANKNLVLIYNGVYQPSLVVLDHGGTPTDPSDDKYTVISTFYDQDGNHLNDGHLFSMYEDPSTGTVWVGYLFGVYTINPSKVTADATRVTRIKVARDDGTNLADYLLNNIPVFRIATDNKGRKWFATGGGGLVCTSADGKTVEGELTVSNSYIPSDNVYTVAYNPDNNSLLMSTEHGIAEFYPSGGSSNDNDGENTLTVYPNPVRPDYLGWVTIENLPDNSIVKITDAAGNLVKELGFAENGMVKWDVTNADMKRVRSGVYYIFASPGSDTENATAKGKILVIN